MMKFTSGFRGSMFNIYMTFGMLFLCLAYPVSALEKEATVPSIKTIIDRVKAHADDYWPDSANYTFLVDVLLEDRHKNGSSKKRKTYQDYIYHYYGKRFSRRLSLNGEPNAGEALIAEDKREREFREKRKVEVVDTDKSDLEGRIEETPVSIVDLIDRYNYKYIRSDTLQGRDAYVVNFSPKKNLKAETRRDNVYNKLTGIVWIDISQFRIIKLDAHLSDNVRIGWIAANIKVTDVLYEQQEIEPGIWMPKTISVLVTGKIFFFKHFGRYTTVDFFDFIPAEENPPGFYRLETREAMQDQPSSTINGNK